MEALLILDVACAQWEVACAEHALASCRALEYETIMELYQFKAQHRAMDLNKKEVDVGFMQAAMNRHGNHTTASISFPATKPCMQAPDGMLLHSPTHCILNITFSGTMIESASG